MIGSEIRPMENSPMPRPAVVAASSAPTNDDSVGKTAANGAEQLPDGIEQVLRHAGSFEHHP